MASDATQVLQCGGTVIYQLLCGRELAKGDQMAMSLANYIYLIVNTLDRTAIAVDAAWDVAGLYSLAKKMDVQLKGCIYTHNHFDHCGGDLPRMMSGGRKVSKPGAREVEEQGGRVWTGREDAEQLRDQCGLKHINKLGDGDVLDCGDLVLHIIHTPGHTPGSISIYISAQCLSPPRAPIGKSPFKEELNLLEELTKAEGGVLITGDTLFPDSCGRIDLPGSNPRQMFSSLSRLSTLDPSVIVLPGHNYAPIPFSTIGRERAQNQMVRAGLSQNPRPPAVPPCCACAGSTVGPKDFIVGRKVVIKGLTSEAGKALNGLPAVVQSFVADTGRYAVRMFAAEEVKSLKAENLETPGPGEKCDAPEPQDEEAPPPPTPEEFVNSACALLDNVAPQEMQFLQMMQGPFDWSGNDPRWYVLKLKLLNGGSMRAAFGDALPAVLEGLKEKFDPKWRVVVGNF
eukprot:gnl/TRDRNA2_/TRDRNA2_174720_c2_seq8.p1 gnl/TRDRNA2_/TRDRNA2_174720_c2~~gnl/TRDRNA2_/TRDRNA2_174720_c2_seq8.p1  ORF type:complete len:456 (+),score=81.75 gnl/TRDRNA2_/TRDRNA2_174720_c2_seq8:80-1447(+)